MGIDFNKIKQRLSELERKGAKKSNDGDSKFIQVKAGESCVVRLLPDPEGDPLKDMFLHYNVDKRAFLCPKRNFNESCAVCDFATSMWNQDDAESKAIAKKYFVNQRFAAAVVKRPEPDDEDKTLVPKIWTFTEKVYDYLMKLMLDPEYGDITDIKTGIDITLTKERQTSDVQYPAITPHPRRKSSHLCEDLSEKECDELVKSAPSVMDAFYRKTPEEVEEILDRALRGAVPAKERKDDGEFDSKSKGGDNVNSVEAAFDEIRAIDD